MTASWEALPVAGAKRLPPDPDFMHSFGLNYTLQAAIADIVDNSIDAGASHILVRFVRDEHQLLGLMVIDNGQGMDGDSLDRAMTIGSRRRYGAGDLGHFGVGLKAASLGQAKSLTVMSRTPRTAVGRRWTIEKATDGFECEVIESSFVKRFLSRDWGIPLGSSGTVVRWDRVKAFPTSSRPDVVERYLEDAVLTVRRHIGLVFHRILSDGRIDIRVDVQDITTDEVGVEYVVEPIDPFGHLRSGRPKYPKILTSELDGKQLLLRCHIWPGRSQLPGFRLPGDSPDTFQGLFFYRRDRLLQAGGWNNVVHPSRDMQLARVAIDIDGFDNKSFAMNSEKTRVDTLTRFVESVEKAVAADGTSFSKFLEDAILTFKDSRTHDRSRPRVISPGKGFAPHVKVAIAYELGFLQEENPLDIRWEVCESDRFFELDRDRRLIRLNKKYRSQIVGQRDGSLNDAPLIKTLLYLLVEQLYHNSFLKSKNKDRIEYLQEIVTAAAEAEIR